MVRTGGPAPTFPVDVPRRGSSWPRLMTAEMARGKPSSVEAEIGRKNTHNGCVFETLRDAERIRGLRRGGHLVQCGHVLNEGISADIGQ